MAVLILLIFIFKIFGLTVSKTENAAKHGKKSAKAEKAAAPAPAPAPKAAPAAAPAPVVQNGISGEIVAAITAAITASEGNSNFTVRSIRVKNVRSRNPWASAAIADNVRPF